MSFEDLMKKMRQDYLTNLHSQLEDLQKMTPPEEHLQSLESFFHKLKGSGASYGLPQISDYGAKYEQSAKEKNFGQIDLEKSIQELQELLAQAD